MEVAYLHVVINHLPIFGVPLALAHGAEDFIEEVRRSSRDAIERHEDAAAWAFAAVMLLAIESLVLFIHAGGLGMLRRRATARKGRA
jgi:hypothetical protein